MAIKIENAEAPDSGRVLQVTQQNFDTSRTPPTQHDHLSELKPGESRTFYAHGGNRFILRELVPLALLLVTVLGASGCDRWPWEGDPAGPSVIVQTSQTVTFGATPAPSPSPTPAQAGFCPTPSSPVASLRFGVRQGTCSQEAARGCAVLALRTGEVAVLDISPLDSAGQLVACHGTLSISAGPSAQVTVTGGGGTDFLPSLRGGSPGSGRVDAEVNGTPGVLLVDVRP